MTDTTTRERVARAIQKAWDNAPSVDHDPHRGTAAEIAADAALAAMQPPTETRWVPYVGKMTPEECERERVEFFAMLRDFADGVSDEVLERAWDHMGTAPGNEPRNFLRALADQEEGT